MPAIVTPVFRRCPDLAAVSTGWGRWGARPPRALTAAGAARSRSPWPARVATETAATRFRRSDERHAAIPSPYAAGLHRHGGRAADRGGCPDSRRGRADTVAAQDARRAQEAARPDLRRHAGPHLSPRA